MTAICSLVSGTNSSQGRAAFAVQPLLVRSALILPARPALLSREVLDPGMAGETAGGITTSHPGRCALPAQNILSTVSSDTTIDCAATALKRIARSSQGQSALLGSTGITTLMWTLKEGPPRGKAAAANVIGARRH